MSSFGDKLARHLQRVLPGQYEVMKPAVDNLLDPDLWRPLQVRMDALEWVPRIELREERNERAD